MKPVNFKQFESVYEALKEGDGPKDIAMDGTTLLDAKTAGSIAESLNNRMIEQEHLDEGLLDTIKNKFQGLFPFTIIGKAKKILADYEKAKMHTLQEVGKERTKAFQMKTKSLAKPDDKLVQTQAEEVTQRTNKVIETIEAAEKTKLIAIENQLKVLARGSQKERITLYIDMALAKLKQRVAEAEIKDAKAYTNEDQMQALQDIVDKREQVADLYMQIATKAKELEDKGELKDGPKLPKVGKAVRYKKEDGEWAGAYKDAKWMVVKDVWNGTTSDNKKVDMTSHVVVMPIAKGQTELGQEMGTAQEPNKDETAHFYIPVKSIEGFENFDENKESTLESNEEIKKLRAQLKALEDQIKGLDKTAWVSNPTKEAPAAKKEAPAPAATKEPIKKPPLPPVKNAPAPPAATA